MPNIPHLVGFDMPSATQQLDQDKVLVALLDRVPDRAWQQALRRHSEQFMLEHAFSQIRLIGKHLQLVGSAAPLRSCAPAVQALLTKITAARRRGAYGELIATPHDPDANQDASDTDARQLALACVSGIANLQQILNEVCAISGMRFATVARVTERRRTTCAVVDLLDFGLLPGQDFVVETRAGSATDPRRTADTSPAGNDSISSEYMLPEIGGFASYISVPLVLGNGAFFGSLCALDSIPVLLSEPAVRRIKELAALISSQLASVGRKEIEGIATQESAISHP